MKLLKGDRWQVGGAERSSVQSLECHLVVPSSGEHPANLQALFISSPPSLSPPGTIPVHSNCPFTQLFLLLVSKLLDAGTIVHYLGYPGRCQRLPNRHSPGGVSCFTGSAPRPSKQGAPPPPPSGACQNWAEDKREHIDSAWKLSLCALPHPDVLHISSTGVWGCLCQQAEAFLRCGLLSRECGKHPARAGPDVARPRQQHLPRPTDIQPYCTSLANSAQPQCTASRGWWLGTRPRHLSCWPW